MLYSTDDFREGDIVCIGMNLKGEYSDSPLLEHMKFFGLSFPEDKTLFIYVGKDKQSGEPLWTMVANDPDNRYPFHLETRVNTEDDFVEFIAKTYSGQVYSVLYDIVQFQLLRMYWPTIEESERRKSIDEQICNSTPERKTK